MHYTNYIILDNIQASSYTSLSKLTLILFDSSNLELSIKLRIVIFEQVVVQLLIFKVRERTINM